MMRGMVYILGKGRKVLAKIQADSPVTTAGAETAISDPGMSPTMQDAPESDQFWNSWLASDTLTTISARTKSKVGSLGAALRDTSQSITTAAVKSAAKVTLGSEQLETKEHLVATEDTIDPDGFETKLSIKESRISRASKLTNVKSSRQTTSTDIPEASSPKGESTATIPTSATASPYVSLSSRTEKETPKSDSDTATGDQSVLGSGSLDPSVRKSKPLRLGIKGQKPKPKNSADENCSSKVTSRIEEVEKAERKVETELEEFVRKELTGEEVKFNDGGKDASAVTETVAADVAEPSIGKNKDQTMESVLETQTEQVDSVIADNSYLYSAPEVSAETPKPPLDQGVGSRTEVLGDSMSLDPKSTGWGDDVSLSILTESQLSTGSGSNVEASDRTDAMITMMVAEDAELGGKSSEPDPASMISTEASTLEEPKSCDGEPVTAEQQKPEVESSDVQPLRSEVEALVSQDVEEQSSDSMEKSAESGDTVIGAVTMEEVKISDSVALVETTIAENDLEETTAGLDVTDNSEVIDPENLTPQAEGEMESGRMSKASTVLSLASSLSTSNTATSMEGSLENRDELSESNRTLTEDEYDTLPSLESSRVIDSEQIGADDSKTQSEMDTKIQGIKDGSKTRVNTGREKSDSAESSSSGGGSGSMSSSGLVKNMLEEAMVESIKDTDSHTDSHSSSDMVRIESGATSGHTSGDEIETTTSSDIEIISHISTPTANGDTPLVDLSPLRSAFTRSLRRNSPPGHKRSDSGSSSQSRNGEDGSGADGAPTRSRRGLNRQIVDKGKPQ